MNNLDGAVICKGLLAPRVPAHMYVASKYDQISLSFWGQNCIERSRGPVETLAINFSFLRCVQKKIKPWTLGSFPDLLQPLLKPRPFPLCIVIFRVGTEPSIVIKWALLSVIPQRSTQMQTSSAHSNSLLGGSSLMHSMPMPSSSHSCLFTSWTKAVTGTLIKYYLSVYIPDPINSIPNAMSYAIPRAPNTKLLKGRRFRLGRATCLAT